MIVLQGRVSVTKNVEVRRKNLRTSAHFIAHGNESSCSLGVWNFLTE
jgi:hypothetical protein